MKKSNRSMNYNNIFRRTAMAFFFAVGITVGISAQNINALEEKDYSIPSWTNLQSAINRLQPALQPYSINMTINGNPASQMGFNWFTNRTDMNARLQIVEKENAGVDDFNGSQIMTFEARKVDASLNYYGKKNQEEIDKTGIKIGEKKDYSAYKALATG